MWQKRDVPWSAEAAEAASRFGTPCYLFSWERVDRALQELAGLQRSLPIRHWLSMKTQPLRRLLHEWRSLGEGVEVVSEFELRAALSEGFPPALILVNGVGKHRWLPQFDIPDLGVHFDSLREVETLTTQAVKKRWRLGIRFAIKGQVDPDEPGYSTQFGMNLPEVAKAIHILKIAGGRLESAHFHLRSNVALPTLYAEALEDLLEQCEASGFEPRYVDCGGGLPCPGELALESDRPPLAFDLNEFAEVLSKGIERFGSAEEIWLENGRFLSSRAGALVLSIVDIKQRSDCRYVICDGGRTNHALVSDWEKHPISTVPKRTGPLELTTICGPTCMAFDRLSRLLLPADLEVGDLLVWENAGAYHLPWETRFSHGLAPVIWIDAKRNMSIAREREDFMHWWSTL